MTKERGPGVPDPDDQRSDLERAVQSRGDEADAPAGRAQSGDTIQGVGGESGAGGVVKNQEGNDQ